MAINLGNGKNIISMTLFDLCTGKECTLFERKGSKCYFHDDIFFGPYIITLRIDWNDIKNADPVLDADIYQNIFEKKGKRLRNGPWHHTLKTFDKKENRKLYNFIFNQLTLKLTAKMTFSLSVAIDSILVK